MKKLIGLILIVVGMIAAVTSNTPTVAIIAIALLVGGLVVTWSAEKDPRTRS